MTFTAKLDKVDPIYIGAAITMSGLLSHYIDTMYALVALYMISCLDTITAIHRDAKLQGMRFNPLNRQTWLMIRSDLLRVWFMKLFFEYSLYIIITFILDLLVLRQRFFVHIASDFKVTLPAFVTFFCIGIEIWSIGENMEKSGNKNYIGIICKMVKDYIAIKLRNFGSWFKKT